MVSHAIFAMAKSTLMKTSTTRIATGEHNSGLQELDTDQTSFEHGTGKQCPDHSNSIFRRSEDHLLTHWGQRF